MNIYEIIGRITIWIIAFLTGSAIYWMLTRTIVIKRAGKKDIVIGRKVKKDEN